MGEIPYFDPLVMGRALQHIGKKRVKKIAEVKDRPNPLTPFPMREGGMGEHKIRPYKDKSR